MNTIYNYVNNYIITENTFEKNCLAMQGKPVFLKVKMMYSFSVWQSSDF